MLINKLKQIRLDMAKNVVYNLKDAVAFEQALENSFTELSVKGFNQ